MVRLTRFTISALVLAVLAAAPPAAAQTDFLTDFLMSEDKERQIAEQEHPKILAQFGGAYQDADLQRYVESIVNYLGRTSQRPDIRYRITILNSPVVNAFALPAGYLYITRGLLALAGNEAELAGVLAHEIGHVTARHTARRFSRAMLAQGVVGLLGAATQNTEMAGLTQMVEVGAVLALQSFSREHEHESDALAIPNMARAGYDPRAMASFLAKLQSQSDLMATLAGQQGAGNQFNLFSTHPRTVERVQRTVRAAVVTDVRDPMVERELYLGKINGILFDDDPEQGFVRGRLFAHPGLNFRFEVPEGFQLLNGQTQVIAQNKDGAAIRFDMATEPSPGSVERYLTETWLKNQPVQALQNIDVNGFPAATAATRLAKDGQEADLRFVAIQASRDRIYRFLFVTPPNLTKPLSKAFRETTYSFRPIPQNERQQLRPRRLALYRTKPGDTVASLARYMPYSDHTQERFRVLNGLLPGQRLAAGQLVKLVTEADR